MKRLLSRWLGVGTDAKQAARPPCCLVDGRAWMNVRGKGRPDPREMINTLQRLGRWAEREAIRIEVFFDGEPLRKAPEGEAINGAVARYVEDRERLADALRDRIHTVGREGYAVTLVTDHDGLEQEAGHLSASCLRPATLRKAIEGGGTEERRGGANGRERGGSARGARRRRGGRKSSPAPAVDNARKPEPPSPTNTANSKDTVRTLLDVVE